MMISLGKKNIMMGLLFALRAWTLSSPTFPHTAHSFHYVPNSATDATMLGMASNLQNL